tara:strand:- start:11406 stop:12128 length:723 start_codon:yes stop_codon:yes gene_type:complete
MKLKHFFLSIAISCFCVGQADAQFWSDGRRISFSDLIADVRVDVSTGMMTKAVADISQYSKTKRNYKVVFGIDPRVDNKYKSGWLYGSIFQYIELEPGSPSYFFSQPNSNGNDSYYSVEFSNLHIFSQGVYYGYEMLMNKDFILTPTMGGANTIMYGEVTEYDINNPMRSDIYYVGGYYFDINAGFEARYKLSSGFGLKMDYVYHYLIETAGNGQVTFGRSKRFYDMTIGIYFNLGPDKW